jgi:hypothetical protein
MQGRGDTERDSAGVLIAYRFGNGIAAFQASLQPDFP